MASGVLQIVKNGVVPSLCAGLLLYIGLCAFLYVYQRHLIFLPPAAILDAPPAGSIYRNLIVEVPDLGRITAWMAPAADPQQPIFVIFHGNGSNRTDFMKTGEALHAQGWGVVLASYRGYSGNPGVPSEAGLMADARATLAALGPAHGPVVLWGHSLGSGVAARMASEGRAAALVLEAPFTTLADVAARAYTFFPVRLLLSYPFDTRSVISGIKVPVLIIHGDKDPVVPIDMGRSLAQALGERATFVPLTGVGHYAHAEDLSDIVVRWMRQKVLAPEARTVAGRVNILTNTSR